MRERPWWCRRDKWLVRCRKGFAGREGVDVEDGDEDGDERILMLSGSALEVGTKESGEGWKRRSFARRPEVGSRVVVQ